MKGLPATFAASEKPSSSRCKTTTRMVWRSISAITWYQNGFSLPHMWVGRAGSFPLFQIKGNGHHPHYHLPGRNTLHQGTWRAKTVAMLPAISIHLTSVYPSSSLREPCYSPAARA
jgi:hypothetical protein